MRQTYTIIVFTLLCVQLASCKKMFIEEPANNPEAIFDNLWQTFRHEYAPFEERNIDWDAEYQHFRPLVNSNTSDSELFDVLSQMLAKLDDGHVTITAPGKELFNANSIFREKTYDELFSYPVIRTYLEPDYKEADENSYIYGKIRNQNIAYIYFDYVGDNFFKIHDFLDSYADVDGYVIDLRHNQGGDFTFCFSEIGRLVDQSRYVFKSKTKNGKGINDYTGWHEWHIQPKGNYVNKPITVLTDRYTISAGERAVMAFMTLPNVTIIGDTTSGAHGTMIGRELANGWFYSLVPQKVELFDGKSYEGIGLAPDIFIKNNLSEINAGTDKTLETAIEHLN